MSTITVKDGTTIYYKDWGNGPAVTFSHGWPLSSERGTGNCFFSPRMAFEWSLTIGAAMAAPAKPRPGMT